MAKRSASSKKKSGSKGRRRGRIVSVDFTDVESGGKIDDGEYICTVEEVEEKESESGNEYLNWKLKTEGGSTLYHITSLQPQALFNLKNTLEACGMEVPQSAFDVDLDSVIGAEVGVIVENETYQGKRRPRVVDLFSPDGEADSDEDEEEPEDEEEEIEEETEEGEWAVGDEVLFKEGRKKYEGVITDLDGEVATVEVDGEEWEIDTADLTPA